MFKVCLTLGSNWHQIGGQAKDEHCCDVEYTVVACQRGLGTHTSSGK